MNYSHSAVRNVLTVKKNSSFFKRQNENSVLEKLEKKKIKFDNITYKKWKVFRVSPIYNFSINNLKFFEKKLNEEFNSKKSRTSNEFFRSKFLHTNMKLKNQYLEVLQVELFKHESQNIYLGIFISWNSTNEKTDDSISLPILLVETTAHDIHGVHSSLCKIFDCDIQPVTFSFYALNFFFVKLLETERSDIDVSQEQVTMEFRVPGCDIYDKIKISLNLQDIIVVFAVVMDDLQEKCKEITTLDIILEFYNKILNHIYQTFKLDLMYAELQKIVFPDAFLTSDGQLRISTENSTISCLDVLKCFTPLDAIITF